MTTEPDHVPDPDAAILTEVGHTYPLWQVFFNLKAMCEAHALVPLLVLLQGHKGGEPSLCIAPVRDDLEREQCIRLLRAAAAKMEAERGEWVKSKPHTVQGLMESL